MPSLLRQIGLRSIQAVIVLFVVSIAVFLLTHVLGDPVRSLLPVQATKQEYLALRHTLGFDQPIWKQYTTFFKGAITGNLGISTEYNLPALQVLKPAVGVTLILAFTSLALAILVGVPVGLLSGYFPNSALDRVVLILVTLGQATPVFVVGVLLIDAFALKMHLLPAGGLVGWKSYALPCVALSLWAMASLIKLSRSALREVLLQPYVLLARAKGLSEPRVIVAHCLRNISAPLLAYGGLLLGGLLTGAVVTEELFGLPGIGQAMLTAVEDLDFNVIQAGVLLTALAFVVVNLVAELLQAAIDPRVRGRPRRHGRRGAGKRSLPASEHTAAAESA